MFKMRLLLLVVATLFLSACVHHLTEVECKTMDWHQEGQKDG